MSFDRDDLFLPFGQHVLGQVITVTCPKCKKHFFLNPSDQFKFLCCPFCRKEVK